MDNGSMLNRHENDIFNLFHFRVLELKNTARASYAPLFE